jgi:hypothetical protein
MKRVLVLALATAMWFGCDDDDDEVEGRVLERRAELTGIGDGAGLRGEADVVWNEDADSFTATAEIRNDEPGSVRPWHVHFGACGSGGAIVGADADYPRMTIGDDGIGSASVRIGERLDPARSYHVNVHESDDNLDNIIACGDLEEVSGGDDAGTAPDSGTEGDAGTVPEGGLDAGTVPEGGLDAGTVTDGGRDAGTVTDGGRDAGGDAGTPEGGPTPLRY